jgi:hypothetical protein
LAVTRRSPSISTPPTSKKKKESKRKQKEKKKKKERRRKKRANKEVELPAQLYRSNRVYECPLIEVLHGLSLPTGEEIFQKKLWHAARALIWGAFTSGSWS